MEKEKVEVKIKNTLLDIFKYINIRPNVSIEQNSEGSFEIKIDGNDLNFLIGYRGESLESLQTILAQVLYREFNEWIRVIVDINGYRDQKMDKIEQITKSFIDRVRFHGKPVEMPPMSPSERRHVHVFLTQYDDVLSESTGEGRFRHIVLSPKK